jgi:hypothetical protein
MILLILIIIATILGVGHITDCKLDEINKQLKEELLQQNILLSEINKEITRSSNGRS